MNINFPGDAERAFEIGERAGGRLKVSGGLLFFFLQYGRAATSNTIQSKEH
jgi:hypothetical protein